MPFNVIVLTGCPNYPEEKIAEVAIVPGMLVTDSTGGAAGKLKPHNVADGGARPAFAIQALAPQVSTLPPSAIEVIDVPYAIGDSVRWVLAHPGDTIYAILPAAAAAIVQGDDLVSNGDGSLKKATAATAVTVGISRSIVAKAVEAINNSGGGTPVRIRVRAV